MDLTFSVVVSATGVWRFPPLGNVFAWGWRTRFFRDPFRRLDVRDFGPLVGAMAHVSLARLEGETEQVWCPVLGIACSTVLGDFDESERDRLLDRRGDSVSMNAVGFKIVIGHRQLAIVLSAVMRQFDLDAADDTVCG